MSSGVVAGAGRWHAADRVERKKRAGEGCSPARSRFRVGLLSLFDLCKRRLRNLPDDSGIVGIVREELRRFLSGGHQDDVRAAVVRKPVRLDILQASLRGRIGVRIFEAFDDFLIERALFAVRSGLDFVRRHALFDQILLDALDAALAEILVITLAATDVGEGFDGNFRVGIIFEILLEATRRSVS